MENRRTPEKAFLAELYRLANGRGLLELSSDEAVCREFGLLDESERLLSSEELFGWKRGGSESYICAAKLVLDQRGSVEVREYLLKAVLGFGPSSPGRLADMLSRYEVLKSEGVGIPRTYHAGDGVFLQEFIPFSLSEFAEGVDDRQAALSDLSQRVLRIARKLDALRFSPVTFVYDLRVTADGEVIVVDVGEDLGSPGQAPAGSEQAETQALLALENLVSAGKGKDGL